MTLVRDEPIAPPALEPFDWPASSYFLFDDVDWAFYEKTIKALHGRNVFATYFAGRLELMAPGTPHERDSDGFLLLFSVILEVLGIDFGSFGRLTLKRPDVEVAVEPDQVIYLANEPKVRGNEHIVLPSDPPPDLALEIEVTHRLGDRIEILAKIGVPELWRLDAVGLHVNVLKDGRYIEVGRSIALPDFPVDAVPMLLKWSREDSRIRWMRRVREWANQELHRD